MSSRVIIPRFEINKPGMTSGDFCWLFARIPTASLRIPESPSSSTLAVCLPPQNQILAVASDLDT
jgi:hypothetical protein